MRRLDMNDPARADDAVELLDGSDYVGKMLDDMNGAQLIEGVIAERIRQPVELAQHIGAAGGIPVDTNRSGKFVDPAADVEDSQFSRLIRLRHSSRMSMAKSAWSRVMVSGGLSRIVFSPAPRISSPFSKAICTTRSRSAEARSRVSLLRTSSMPNIRPMPRTSPTSRNFFGHSRRRSIIYAPTLREFSISSFSSNSSVTRPAAHATGLPPKVDACAPGGQLISSARAMVAPSGSPLAIPLATARISGAALKCSDAHSLPERPIPDCTSSKMSSIPKRLAMRANSSMNFCGGTMYPPSP